MDQRENDAAMNLMGMSHLSQTNQLNHVSSPYPSQNLTAYHSRGDVSRKRQLSDWKEEEQFSIQGNQMHYPMRPPTPGYYNFPSISPHTHSTESPMSTHSLDHQEEYPKGHSPMPYMYPYNSPGFTPQVAPSPGPMTNSPSMTPLNMMPPQNGMYQPHYTPMFDVRMDPRMDPRDPRLQIMFHPSQDPRYRIPSGFSSAMLFEHSNKPLVPLGATPSPKIHPHHVPRPQTPISLPPLVTPTHSSESIKADPDVLYRMVDGKLVPVTSPIVSTPTSPVQEKTKKKRKQPPTKKKRFECDWERCDKTFSTAANLNRHKSLHLPHQPFPCPISHCKSRFHRPDTMREHYLAHVRRLRTLGSVVGNLGNRKYKSPKHSPHQSDSDHVKESSTPPMETPTVEENGMIQLVDEGVSRQDPAFRALTVDGRILLKRGATTYMQKNGVFALEGFLEDPLGDDCV